MMITLFVYNMEVHCHIHAGIDSQESLDQTDQLFKPGWKEIFRMNQTEIESEIGKVNQVSTLDPRREAYLVKNLMTRFVPILII